MDMISDPLSLARTLHVLGVVLWIGGLAFVTSVVLPVAGKEATPRDGLRLFQRVEKVFVWQARATTLLTGLSGFSMLWLLDAWDRLAEGAWWVHAMVALWAVFTLALFVLEPLVLHRIFHAAAERNPGRALRVVRRVHWGATILSLVVVAGAVTGVHG